MINKYKIITNRILRALIQMEENQRARLEELRDYGDISLKLDKRSNGTAYYYATPQTSSRETRTYKYVGAESNSTVRYAGRSIF